MARPRTKSETLDLILDPFTTPAILSICGTPEGYRLHNRDLGEEACRACKDAEAAYRREIRAKKSSDPRQ